MIDVITKDLNEMKEKNLTRLGERNIIQSNIMLAGEQTADARMAQQKNNMLIALLQKAAELSRNVTTKHIENVCTMALKFVFDKDLEFVIDINEQKTGACADFYIQYDNGTEKVRVKPEDSSGGGVIDVLSIALRFCFNELQSDPKIQGAIVFDEPAKMVSEIASGKMAVLLSELKTTFNRQVIMVTHNDMYALTADKIFNVTMSGVLTTVAEVTNKNTPAVFVDELSQYQMDLSDDIHVGKGGI